MVVVEVAKKIPPPPSFLAPKIGKKIPSKNIPLLLCSLHNIPCGASSLAISFGGSEGAYLFCLSKYGKNTFPSPQPGFIISFSYPWEKKTPSSPPKASETRKFLTFRSCSKTGWIF